MFLKELVSEILLTEPMIATAEMASVIPKPFCMINSNLKKLNTHLFRKNKLITLMLMLPQTWMLRSWCWRKSSLLLKKPESKKKRLKELQNWKPSLSFFLKQTLHQRFMFSLTKRRPPLNLLNWKSSLRHSKLFWWFEIL